MISDSETAAALRRAARRAAWHLLRAGVETLRAVEAVADELASVGREPEKRDGGRRVRIEVE